MTSESTPWRPKAAAAGRREPVGATPTGTGLRRRRRRRWTCRCSLGLAVLLFGAAGAGWVAYEKLDSNITADTDAASELARHEKERPTSIAPGALNILVIGSDSRSGAGNSRYGRDSGTERSDTTILLHLAADRRSATAVSLPRDLMVDVPSCRRPDGSQSEAAFTMLNHAFANGGSACTIRTVEKLTNIRIDHHMVVDFEGFTKMVDAVDGVEVCLKQPIDDRAADLKLPAGRVTLDGEQALGYVRARKSLGDGSDTERMERQQRFLGALVSKVRSDGVLLNPVKLYPVLDAATSSLTADPGLASLRRLYELVHGLRNLPTDDVQFLTAPRTAYPYDTDRDQLVEPEAHELFGRLRADEPVAVTKEVAANSPSGTSARTADDRDGEQSYGDGKSHGKTAADSTLPDRAPTPPPTFRGNTATQDACG
ncbi:LCP family protein [Streptomyces sp. MI02-2A]|uniref:LCP family protein n=1 Tax=unclassified Streptomyces TaxID=2593676 RepID=UPI000740DF54|nr:MULTISPECIES: LCP family protein [unclassified Streptomyces]KUJ37709.1 LytR family transcriptional regulator [Streptomyces sp. NRRL F-5122]MDX3262836.1 LCP family protein [Streptomyces sp. MI02-2A]REE61183.1 LytR family transcriptional attenuator [Streptomyces sp. 3212.3]